MSNICQNPNAEKSKLALEALKYHSLPHPGKIEVEPSKPYDSPEDLALAYSPGVAYPSCAIFRDRNLSYKYTNRGNLVGVISNGTAVLGLGNIGAEAAKPVMEGKALLFKIFAGIDSYDIEISETNPIKLSDTIISLAPTFGGINLEDIKAPECFEVERRVKQGTDIPVMHDDQHGTAIVSGAALLNALEISGKAIDKARVVINGAGAAAISCARLYISLGISPMNIVMCDSHGPITKERKDLSTDKAFFATSRHLDTLADAVKDADVFVGLSVGDVLTPAMLMSMAPKAVIFALANPNPEIKRELAFATRKDIIFATGRSDYPNQINNVLAFPYIFRGALDTQASEINEAMKIAAVRALAALAHHTVPEDVLKVYKIKELEFGPDYIIPRPFDKRLLPSVSTAVAEAAMLSGVARHKIENIAEYEKSLSKLIADNDKMMEALLESGVNI